MSNEAITWALTRPIKHSTAKFVLVVLANCADNESWLAWPSVAHLAEATGQDRKTVIENIRRLKELGYISDSGMRKGNTGQVLVYQLNSTETGVVKESQKRNSTDKGTVPEFPINSTEIPHKESQFSVVTVPKTGHGTINEPSNETSGKPNKRKQADAFVLPDWIPLDAWNGYIDMRKKKRKEPTDYACKLVIDELAKLRDAGHDLKTILNNSIKAGWTDVYAPKADQQARASPTGSTLGKAGQATAAAAKRFLENSDASQ